MFSSYATLIGVRVSECGFEPYERDDGLQPQGSDGAYDEQSKNALISDIYKILAVPHQC